MSYDWVLFDADETLFEFDSFRGLRLMFSDFGVDFTRDDYERYQAVNKPLWTAYQDGSVTAAEVKTRRFESWAERLGRRPQELNSAFLAAMAEICAPLEGAESLLRSLRGAVRVGVITNGFTDLQELRLSRTGLRGYVDVLVVSEEVGAAKPDRRIFDRAHALMGAPRRERVLMVGDNPHADVRGGLDAGYHACWLNRAGQNSPAGIVPTFEVNSLAELERRLHAAREH